MENAESRTLIGQMGPKESIIEHAGNILDTLLPVGGVRFLHIGPGEWPDREDLGNEITDWMAESVELQPGLDLDMQQDFEDGLGLVRVRVQHLLHDHCFSEPTTPESTSGVGLKWWMAPLRLPWHESPAAGPDCPTRWKRRHGLPMTVQPDTPGSQGPSRGLGSIKDVVIQARSVGCFRR